MSFKEQRAVEMVKLLIERQTDEINRLRDEITQLQTALTIKNGTIDQLKARGAELEAQKASGAYPKPSVLKDRNVTYSTSTQQAPARQVSDALQEIGDLLRTQDNRMTDRPIFVVLQKREMVAHEDYDHDRIEWVDDEGIAASKAKALRLEELYQGGRDKDGWRRLAIKEVDEFVTACFTERGCQEYLEVNGHNLRKPFICAYGSFRNAEFRAVRDWLMDLPALPKESTHD